MLLSLQPRSCKILQFCPSASCTFKLSLLFLAHSTFKRAHLEVRRNDSASVRWREEAAVDWWQGRFTHFSEGLIKVSVSLIPHYLFLSGLIR